MVVIAHYYYLVVTTGWLIDDGRHYYYCCCCCCLVVTVVWAAWSSQLHPSVTNERTNESLTKYGAVYYMLLLVDSLFEDSLQRKRETI